MCGGGQQNKRFYIFMSKGEKNAKALPVQAKALLFKFFFHLKSFFSQSEPLTSFWVNS